MSNTTIKRNGKTYYKVAKYPYIYKGLDGYYIYRLIHKESKTDTYVVKNNLTNDKFTTVQEANEDRIRRLAAIGGDKFSDCGDYTVNRIWEEMLTKATKKAEGTIRKHSSVYKYHVEPVFGETKLKNLVVGDITDHLLKLYTEGDDTPGHIGGYAYSFVESVLKWFYWFYNYCYEHDYINKDTFDKFIKHGKMPVEKAEDEELKLRVLSDEEIRKILAMMRNSDLFIPVLISLTTGLRPSECFALTWDDIDFEANEIKVNKKIVEEKGGYLVIKKTKTKGSKREVSFPKVLREELKKRKGALYEARVKSPAIFKANETTVYDDRKKERELLTVSNFVCVDLYGRYIKSSSFNYWAKRIRAEICPHIDGVEDFSFYTFRKTHISKMAPYLTELVLIQHTGHTKVDTIRKYYAGLTDNSKDFIREAVNTVGNNFGTNLNQADRDIKINPTDYIDSGDAFHIEDTDPDAVELFTSSDDDSINSILPATDSDDIDF